MSTHNGKLQRHLYYQKHENKTRQARVAFSNMLFILKRLSLHVYIRILRKLTMAAMFAKVYKLWSETSAARAYAGDGGAMVKEGSKKIPLSMKRSPFRVPCAFTHTFAFLWSEKIEGLWIVFWWKERKSSTSGEKSVLVDVLLTFKNFCHSVRNIYNYLSWGCK